MSVPRLLQLRDAVVAAVREAVPDIDVEGHLGRFDEKELVEFMAKAPAVRVAVLGLEDGRATSDDGVDYTARLGLYVVTKDGAARMSRDAAALAIVEQLLTRADRTRWGLAFCRPSERLSAQNLYSREIGGKGVAMWAIDMRQPVRLAPERDAAGALTALFLGVAPDVGAAHRDDYIPIGAAA